MPARSIKHLLTTRPNDFWDAHAATNLWKTWLLNFHLIRLSIHRLVGSLEKVSLSKRAPIYGNSRRGNFRFDMIEIRYGYIALFIIYILTSVVSNTVNESQILIMGKHF